MISSLVSSEAFALQVSVSVFYPVLLSSGMSIYVVKFLKTIDLSAHHVNHHATQRNYTTAL